MNKNVLLTVQRIFKNNFFFNTKNQMEINEMEKNRICFFVARTAHKNGHKKNIQSEVQKKLQHQRRRAQSKLKIIQQRKAQFTWLRTQTHS